jgi:hypothetical protein
MHDVRNDFFLGLILSIVCLFILFILIPMGIEQPLTHDPGQISPAAYPAWIVRAAVVFSLLLTINAGKKLCAEGGLFKPAPLISRITFLKVCIAFALLFLFAICIEETGMILGCFLLYIGFALLSGERNWLRLLLVDAILCSALYIFFIHIASVPAPLGPLQYFF